MPLDPSEVITIGADVGKLLAEIAHDLRADSDGGRKLTRAEGRELLDRLERVAADLAAALLD